MTKYQQLMMSCSNCQYEGQPDHADYYGTMIDVCPECEHEAQETWLESLQTTKELDD